MQLFNHASNAISCTKCKVRVFVIDIVVPAEYMSLGVADTIYMSACIETFGSYSSHFDETTMKVFLTLWLQKDCYLY